MFYYFNHRFRLTETKWILKKKTQNKGSAGSRQRADQKFQMIIVILS